MELQLSCPDHVRKARVRDETTLNAIDFLEVCPSQRTLLVHCLRPVTGLDEDNVLIEGGVRVTGIHVAWARPANALTAPVEPRDQSSIAALTEPDHVLVVRTSARGDYSRYRLRLAASTVVPETPPPGFDDLLVAVDFSFKVDCPSRFDCKPVRDCPEPPLVEPQIDYLAKDYASFRRLMLDRLAIVLPKWTERHEADVGIALVELLAYVADGLSYYQDAVATEAYLGTARRRVSVRRHARLVDYFLHDGANARAWVCFQVEQGGDLDGGTLHAPTTLQIGRAHV